MRNVEKPPKFKPTKDDKKQLEATYQHFLDIVEKYGGVCEKCAKTMDEVLVRLVTRLFRERHDKNWYKVKLSQLNRKD